MADGPQYLRLSVTGRCAMRCIYCRGTGSVAGKQRELTVDQLRLLAECAAAEGVRKIRLTGGEPLQRDDLERVVATVARGNGVDEVCLTTNGVGLAERAVALRQAGLDRVNVSLDTLRADRFRAMTGTPLHAAAMRAVRAAADVFASVKLNAVLLRGVNEDEVADLARFGADIGARVRFVEYYRVHDGAEDLEGVPSEVVLELLRDAFGKLEAMPAGALSVEEVYLVPSLGGATVGIVRSASSPPCARCAKLRVAASGELLGCLFAESGRALGPALRGGDREAVRQAIRAVWASKRRGGPGGRQVGPVCQIGG